DPRDHGDLAGVQAYQCARRVDAEQLHEAANEVLIELRSFRALEYRDDPIARVRLLIRALRPHRVVDVADTAEQRVQVERLARDAERVAAAIETQVMLEGHDRREDWHFRRPAQNLGAVHHVPAHDDELVVGELAGLVEDLLRRAYLSDVVHERRESELTE